MSLYIIYYIILCVCNNLLNELCEVLEIFLPDIETLNGNDILGICIMEFFIM